MKLKFSISKLSILLVLVTMLAVTGSQQQYRQGVIKYDIVSYYAYLPAVFIYKDLTFSFIDQPLPKEVDICTERTPENRRVLKMSSGLAILYAPFFLIAHTVALLQPDMYAPNGYSMIYSLFLIISDIFYTTLGFIFLRKILLRHFSETITTFTILGLFFGTNLYFYSMFEVMSHNYLFCCITLFLYYSIQWHQKPSFKLSICLGLLLGLITLIRPVDILAGLLWSFYGIYSIQMIKDRIQFLWKFKLQVILIPVLTIGVFFIQMSYWKYATGHWLYWSYTNEYFFWLKPHIVQGLFGFRKGLFIYAPILFFSTIGMLLTYKYVKEFFLPILLLFCLFTYVVLCWWCWSYGGGLSIRPMIDIYCIFGIGLACFLHFLFQFQLMSVKLLSAASLIAFIYYGYFVNWQYLHGLIHYDSMNYTTWKMHFMQTKLHPGFYDHLTEPDYGKARRYGED